MVLQHGLPRRPLTLPAPVAAIGIFDGVHRGHQAILRRASARARALRGAPVAVTFFPHPSVVLRPAEAPPPLLTSLDQRLREFARCGIRAAWVIPFTRAFCRWPPERFVRRVLLDGLRVREVVVGHDFGFGSGRSGTVGTLRRLGRRHGFQVHVVAPVRLGRSRISSRVLRALIRRGKLAQARRMLGRSAAVTGRVVRGSGRGRRLGFATANLRLESGVLPPMGVYAVRAALLSKGTRYTVPGPWFSGMANLGVRPTFRESGRTPLLEVHLFGLRRPLYGARLEVEFHRWLRPERRFASPQALAAQLARDSRSAKLALRSF